MVVLYCHNLTTFIVIAVWLNSRNNCILKLRGFPDKLSPTTGHSGRVLHLQSQCFLKPQDTHHRKLQQNQMLHEIAFLQKLVRMETVEDAYISHFRL